MCLQIKLLHSLSTYLPLILPFVMTRRLNIQYFALISGLRRDVNEICGLLGNYTASFTTRRPVITQKTTDFFNTLVCNYAENDETSINKYLPFAWRILWF
jgi:hypothetical protein